MNPRAFLPAVAMAAATAMLPACVSQGPTMASAPETVSLQPCEQITGSRIVRPQNRTSCGESKQPMKTFSQEEIQATGETDLANALRRLDPAFQ